MEEKKWQVRWICQETAASGLVGSYGADKDAAWAAMAEAATLTCPGCGYHPMGVEMEVI